MANEKVAILQLLDTGHNVVRQRMFAPILIVDIDFRAIKPVEAILCQYPHIATAVLKKASDVGVRQSVVGGP